MSAISELDLTPGTVVCLHCLHGRTYPLPDVETELARNAGQRSRSTAVARLTRPRRRIRDYFRRQTSVAWLSATAKISSHEAEAIIGSFGIRVSVLMCHNAANPRRFLGVAAALSRRPDVLVYETSGMDPYGRFRLHEFITEHGRELCAVHLSHASRSGTGEPAARICPGTAHCVEISNNP